MTETNSILASCVRYRHVEAEPKHRMAEKIEKFNFLKNKNSESVVNTELTNKLDSFATAQNDHNNNSLTKRVCDSFTDTDFSLFTKPSIGISEAKVEPQSTETLSFSCWSECCRLMRGAVNNQNRKVAFTLAEVLISLGIIGVVAALTLPTLISNYKEKELIVRTKRLYANIQNAALLAQKENDSIGDNSALFNPSQSSAEVAKNFSKYFTGSKVCTNMNTEGCSQYYYKLKYATRRKGEDGNLGGGIQNFSKIILEDGAIIGVAQSTSCDKLVTNCRTDTDGNCMYDEQGNPLMYTYRNTICAYLWLDVNGVSLPNQYGRDGYVIQVYTDKMKPEQTRCWGGNSFYNILTGKDKLEYVKYNIGDNY